MTITGPAGWDSHTQSAPRSDSQSNEIAVVNSYSQSEVR